MSGLDADLYGDLYGNDETDFNEQAQEEICTRGIGANRVTQHNTMTTTKAADTKPVVKSSQAIPKENCAGAGNYTTSTRYTQPASQKIPTYEQPQPSEYREPPAPRTDEGYQNIPVTERSVRSLEMKDEG
ncbi:hypothetical protein K443DRAFT_683859 [Laccaria amethystina LaAM-08-1]|uniref:Uncharacterized protein n=1 Tax=Laccaria amethystina LaAM-08-1 TaxID=1095629 RepID=A0A0C9XDS9_9AGAR|nr:hypothetical protein K443DRAFT_683859 [Laccaria amethystina LaAM-08-1]